MAAAKAQPKGLTMKIYILMLAMGVLFTALRYTSIKDSGSKQLPQ